MTNEPSQIILILPLFCGEHSIEDISSYLVQTPLKKLNDYIEKKIPTTLHLKRKKLSKIIGSRIKNRSTLEEELSSIIQQEQA